MASIASAADSRSGVGSDRWIAASSYSPITWLRHDDVGGHFGDPPPGLADRLFGVAQADVVASVTSSTRIVVGPVDRGEDSSLTWATLTGSYSEAALRSEVGATPTRPPTGSGPVTAEQVRPGPTAATGRPHADSAGLCAPRSSRRATTTTRPTNQEGFSHCTGVNSHSRAANTRAAPDQRPHPGPRGPPHRPRR